MPTEMDKITAGMVDSRFPKSWLYWFQRLVKLIGQKLDIVLDALGKLPVLNEKGELEASDLVAEQVVQGQGTSTTGHVAMFADTTATLIEDAGAALPEPSETVVSETSYGQDASAGSEDDTTYSKGSHTHGTPEVPAFDDLSDVDFTDEAHGDLAFRGADKWNNLPAGDAGQVLTSRGDGADPTWEDLPGTVDLATLIHGATEKPSLADNDEFPMTDSADTYALKKMLASDLKAALKTYFDTMYLTSLEASWPVGSIFLSVVATSPRILLGFGTWSRIAEGKFLVGQEAADEDFDTAEKTGGEKTHTLTSAEMPEHTHVQNPHQHDLSSIQTRLLTGTATTWDIFADGDSSSACFDPGTYLIPAATATNQNTGGGAAHNNLPPYTVVYAWKRLSSYWPSGYWPSGYWPEGYWPN